MEIARGTIERIDVEVIPEDNFGNTFRRKVIIAGAVYDFGGGKRAVINVKQGQAWVELKQGMSVEFTYETRNFKGRDFYNAKSSSVKILAEKANAVSSAANAVATPVVKTKSNDYETGVAVGHAVNCAIQMACAEYNAGIENSLDNKSIEKKAWDILKLTTKLKNTYVQVTESEKEKQSEKVNTAENTKPDVDTTKSTTPVSSQTASVTKKVKEEVSFEDDDIPF